MTKWSFATEYGKWRTGSTPISMTLSMVPAALPPFRPLLFIVIYLQRFILHKVQNVWVRNCSAQGPEFLSTGLRVIIIIYKSESARRCEDKIVFGSGRTKDYSTALYCSDHRG